MVIFRKAVGAIILDNNNDLIAFNRFDYPNSYQGPEGGIENNESEIEAIQREVFEEIGLKNTDYDILQKTNKPFRYLYTKEAKTIKHFEFDGQEKTFFLLKLKNKNINFKFDVIPEEIEFIEYKVFKNINDFIKVIPLFKEEMYKEVLKEFNLIK